LILRFDTCFTGFCCPKTISGGSSKSSFRLLSSRYGNDANKIENEWAIHQVETTANFAMNNKIISWLVGGLNYQVEHHLYPKISHIHYPQISKIVRETCDEMQVKYNAFPSFWRAILSHYGYLKLLGTK
jgi:linoleoyl-CoA desaturase